VSLGVIVPAAGRGERLGANIPKALVSVGNTPLLTLTCRALTALTDVAVWVVLAPPQYESAITDLVRDALPAGADLRVRTGGAERADSVRIGLDALSDACEFVAVHDAARPCVSREELRAVVTAARETGAAILARPCTDTVKQSLDGRTIHATLDRSTLWLAQTPQVFRTSLLKDALAKAGNVTDEAAAVERFGHAVTLVGGRAENIKVTTEADLAIAAEILEQAADSSCASA